MLDQALQQLPLVAILRGVKPDEVEAVADALYAEGFRVIEVPLNSPQALDSIGRLARRMPEDALIGAGTVLSADAVRDVQIAGGRLIVMPHADVAVIRVAKARGLACVPGAATPTEAFAALQAGADALKLFPAELVTPPVLKAMRAVLPRELRLLPVGGITPETMAVYRKAGAAGFGLGSALYSPGMTAADVTTRARAFAQAWAKP
ncbi:MULTISPECIES: 2-dehydro-3-deoxy-6-phosphogalactonate aldolase [unclassified Roseateles]|uniref:2-dehydro-3-deoxy-6-phosphogalactonate aldolase n=1 Tax=unclassified Roseateles TaxID=2626991 RepID=UPI0006F5EE22|nr:MULTISPECIES: 2-dehydro-3-deoxy-6-phosphogalactonate aldolase [unclassified Roseateles]KQW43624.1 2-dehydro-3-deoxy-6-phosphogalactonate aldolase [Pelomonas sp. Root405]KRA71362.1 2-dehydro-3-deoxy-6-phosphogalactonate aldolase [Pelomonas sp. Root662]